MQETAESSAKISRATSVSPVRIYNSSSKKKLREELKKTEVYYKLRVNFNTKTRRMKKNSVNEKCLTSYKTKQIFRRRATI